MKECDLSGAYNYHILCIWNIPNQSIPTADAKWKKQNKHTKKTTTNNLVKRRFCYSVMSCDKLEFPHECLFTENKKKCSFCCVQVILCHDAEDVGTFYRCKTCEKSKMARILSSSARKLYKNLILFGSKPTDSVTPIWVVTQLLYRSHNPLTQSLYMSCNPLTALSAFLSLRHTHSNVPLRPTPPSPNRTFPLKHDLHPCWKDKNVRASGLPKQKKLWAFLCCNMVRFKFNEIRESRLQAEAVCVQPTCLQ